MISLPLLSPPLDRKNCAAMACDLGDCLIASPAVMCTPLDISHRKKNLVTPRKPVPRRRRSASLTSLTQPLCPVDNGRLSPKAMELLGNLSLNAVDLKPLPLQTSAAGAAAAQGCEACMTHPEPICSERILNSTAHSNDGQPTSLEHKGIISASETPRPRSTGNNSDDRADNAEVVIPSLSRKERIEAFESERRRRSHKSNSQLEKARPASAEPHASCAQSRAERIKAFEADRRRCSRKHDNQLLKLLKIQAAQAPTSSADPHASVVKRRAEYETKRHEEVLKRQKLAQEAKEFVRQYMDEWRVPADVAQAVVGKSLLKARMDGTGGIEKEVTLDMVLESYEEAKGDFFRSKLEPLLAQKCPSGMLRDLIHKSSTPWNWVSCLNSKLADDIFRNCSSSLAEFTEFVTQSTRLTCPICADPMFSVSDDGSGVECNFWSAASRKNEHWDNHACGHFFCRSCAGRWAETAINDQKLHIRCPAPGCKYKLMDQDVRELVSSKMFLRHQEHLYTDHLKNLKGLAKEDDDLMAWLRQNARPCPDCHVVVSRTEGCNSMLCVCGTRFCYACGFKKCQCGVKSRNDIWAPNP